MPSYRGRATDRLRSVGCIAQSVEILDTTLDCFDITKLGIDIEQVPKNGAWNPVANRLLDSNRPETFRQAVTNGRASLKSTGEYSGVRLTFPTVARQGRPDL